MLEKMIMAVIFFVKKWLLPKKEITSSENYISLQDLLKITQSQKKEGQPKIIDIRTPKEVEATGVIPGAIVHDYFADSLPLFIDSLDKTQSYILYCKVGGRSGKLSNKMKALGFQVKDLSEGMDGWLAKNYKTEAYEF